MKRLDTILRDWRISKAVAFVRVGDRLLDVGCFDDRLLRRAAPLVVEGVGIDPLAVPKCHRNTRVLRAEFPCSYVFPDESFDCITMVAVLEHVDDAERTAAECLRLLKPTGRLIVTVPSPNVDRILRLLQKLNLADGMSSEEHHGFDVHGVRSLFERVGLRLRVRRSFQLGLNHLFVFEKAAK